MMEPRGRVARMMAPPARSVADDFRWGRKLGQGSFGVVYEVHRKACGRRFVVKQCHIGRMSRAEQEEAITEVHLLASLKHEYIVQYHDSFIGAGQLNIVMEHCPGGDLASKLAELRKRGQRLPEASVWRYLLQVASALRFVHKEKILHRDLKSQNVFLGANGDVRLGDFGVSKLLESTSDLARTKVGTPYFMSPELCESRPYSSKSDVWALGCLLYEMVALRPPFEADNIASLVLRIIRGRYDPVCRTYSPDVAWVVNRCRECPPRSRTLSDPPRATNSRPTERSLTRTCVCSITPSGSATVRGAAARYPYHPRAGAAAGGGRRASTAIPKQQAGSRCRGQCGWSADATEHTAPPLFCVFPCGGSAETCAECWARTAPKVSCFGRRPWPWPATQRC